jgi:hypothetical protein
MMYVHFTDNLYCINKYYLFIRSKIQLLMDTAEDDWANKELHLDLSGFQSAYISSRLYDLSCLHTLNLENNRITKLSDQLSYLSK